MTHDTEQRQAGRPRDPRIERAALDATRVLLLEGGWAAVTMAAVAERAGTTKAALYRRWPSVVHLAYEAAFPDELALDLSLGPDLRADLAWIVTGTRDAFSTPVVAAALPPLLAEFSRHPQLHASLLARFTPVFAALDERLREAQRAGQCRADARADDLVRLIVGDIVVGLMLGPSDLDDAWAERLTTTLWKGLAP